MRRNHKIILAGVLIMLFPIFAGARGPRLNYTSEENAPVYMELKYEKRNEIPVVQVVIGDQTYDFLLDTGAGKTCVTRSLALELGLDITGSALLLDSQQVTRETEIVFVDKMTIGQVIYRPGECFVLDEESHIMRCLGLDGILGGNFLQNFTVKFDSREEIITITDLKNPFEIQRSQWSRLMHRNGTTPLVKLNVIYGDKKKKNGLFVTVDTGSGYLLTIYPDEFPWYVDNGAVSQMETGYGTGSMGLHGERVFNRMYRGFFKELYIGNSSYTDFPVRTGNANNRLLGMPVTEMGELILDYPRKRFCFIPYGNAPADPDDITNLFVVQDGKWMISALWGHPLLELVSPGDILVSIAGELPPVEESCFAKTLEIFLKEHDGDLTDEIIFSRPDGTFISIRREELISSGGTHHAHDNLSD